MEVWLRSIGLGERITVFRDQGITLDQVTDLTDQDLRELGLTIGDRIRFRNAVKSTRAESCAQRRYRHGVSGRRGAGS